MWDLTDRRVSALFIQSLKSFFMVHEKRAHYYGLKCFQFAPTQTIINLYSIFHSFLCLFIFFSLSCSMIFLDNLFFFYNFFFSHSSLFYFLQYFYPFIFPFLNFLLINFYFLSSNFFFLCFLFNIFHFSIFIFNLSFPISKFSYIIFLLCFFLVSILFLSLYSLIYTLFYYFYFQFLFGHRSACISWDTPFLMNILRCRYFNAFFCFLFFSFFM